MDLIYKDEVYEIIGAAMEVHKILGCGFLEAIYQEVLAMEFIKRNIPFEQEKMINIEYKGVVLKKFYQADFLCYDKIIIETKALSELSSEHESQILNYLKATGKKLGLLINFGQKSLIYHRYVY